jgi:hypothetical protein
MKAINPRPDVAETKAVLSLELHRLIRRVPASIAAAGVIKTRRWVKTHAKCKSIAIAERSSVPQLLRAIQRMREAEAYTPNVEEAISA